MVCVDGTLFANYKVIQEDRTEIIRFGKEIQKW